jgi:hypothetical protein
MGMLPGILPGVLRLGRIYLPYPEQFCREPWVQLITAGEPGPTLQATFSPFPATADEPSQTLNPETLGVGQASLWRCPFPALQCLRPLGRV